MGGRQHRLEGIKLELEPDQGFSGGVKICPPMQETQVRSLHQEDLLEKEMAAHSSILGGEFQGQSSLVGFSPWGCRVRHD